MKTSTKKTRILVHICCAACASYVFSELEKEKFNIIGFFYNPEVHGLAEYKRRLADVKTLCEEKGIELIVPEYDVAEFFSLLMPYQDKNSIKFITDKDRYRRRRCQVCVSLLLKKTSIEAKKRRIGKITTTMLCSPFRNHNEIWNTGEDICTLKKPAFCYKDFRKGYWNGRNFARTHNYNIAKYCGCSESLEEGQLE